MSGRNFPLQAIGGAFFLACVLLFPAAAAALSIERVVSPGGIEAWLARDTSVPVVSVEIAFRESGSAMDPNGKEGLAYLASGLLDEGAGDLDSQAFRRALEENAITLSFDTGRDAFTGSLKTLRKNHETAFNLLRLALSTPRFDSEAVKRIRNQVLTMLAYRADDPNTIAQRAWLRAMFPDHPYGQPRRGTAASIKAMTAKDLRGFVGRNLVREKLIIGVSGDISAAELAPLLDHVFGALPQRSAKAFSLEKAKVKGEGKTLVIEKPIPQSIVIFGQAGVKRNDPDYYAAYVMNHLLGGGLHSRLSEAIRVDRGLAYSVYSYLYPLDKIGLLLGQVATRNDRVEESMRLVRAEWKRLSEEPVGEAELRDAKTYLTGAFPLTLDSTDRVAGVLVAIQQNDLGIDYIDRRNGYIEAVTVEDIARVARRLLGPEKFCVVAVGQPKGLATTATAD
ncbi:MAG: insulinase family protein [Alphaproteobacteria bacterium]|nr:insulinase family protein [Alphaproteobacteria bacterium]